MPIVNFVPDPTAPYGTGTFTNDAGRSWYSYDPDAARSVVTAPPPDATNDTETEPPAPPGTRISFAGDTGSPYYNALASNDGATGTAAGATPDASSSPSAPLMSVAPALSPADLVSKVTQVVPSGGTPAGGAGAAAPVVIRTPAQAAAAAAAVLPPIVKTTETTVNGRSKKNVEAEVGALTGAEREQEAANTQKATGDEARANASLDQRIAARDLAVRQAREDQIQQQQDKAQVDKQVSDLLDHPDAQIDPDRYINSLPTGSKIGLAVLAAVSGFANGLRNAGAPNSQGGPPDLSVLNVLNRRVDQDIESQKDALAAGRVRSNNQLARLVAKGATLDQAIAATRATILGAVADSAELTAQKLGLQGQAADNAKVFVAGIRQQLAQQVGTLRAQTEARTQTTREQETGKPAKSAESIKQFYETYTAAQKAGATDDQLGALATAFGMPKPTGKTEDQIKAEAKAADRTEGQAKAAAVVTAAQPYADSLGLVQDPKTGKFAAPVGHEDDSLPDAIGTRMLVGATGDDSAREAFRKQHSAVTGARTQMAAALVAASGGGMKLGEAEDLIDGETLGEIANRLNAQLSSVSELRNTVERNATPSAVSSLGFKPVGSK